MRSEIHIWSALIGFDREAEDKGVGAFLARCGEVRPTAISIFLFHPDIVLQHDGMTAERVLPPDNCSYYASARNDDRERQPWTNYDLRRLVEELHRHGVEAYCAIMGIDLDNRFHREWISDHPELRYAFSKGRKRGYDFSGKFADGRRFDEYFIGKLRRTLADYGFDGVQASDFFSPYGHLLGTISSAFFDTFLRRLNRKTPPELADIVGDDSNTAVVRRGEWLKRNAMLEWIEFRAGFWTGFWRKLCTALHADGKKVITLGMYCTDPLETLYCLGLDQRALVDEAGVDYLMPNIVPTGLMLIGLPYRFHRYMTLAMLTEACSPAGKFVSLLGVRDVTEEWDVLHHAPDMLERDIYTLLGFMRDTGSGVKPALDGLMMCLGDGIRAEEWRWLAERLKAAETTVDGADGILSPKVVWSDSAFRRSLPVYHATCRWTLHKWVYEMAERGSMSLACVRIEDVPKVAGPLFVPNFDLLPPEERKLLADYRGGSVIATAPADFSPADCGIVPDFRLEDPFASYPMSIFVRNAPTADFSGLAEFAAKDDDAPDPEVDELRKQVPFQTFLHDTLPFRKVSAGFADACAELLRRVGPKELRCDMPCFVLRMKSGALRIFLPNPELNRYTSARVTAEVPIRSVSIVTKYPILPVKFLSSPEADARFMAQDSDGTQRTFKIKIAPGGVTVADVML